MARIITEEEYRRQKDDKLKKKNKALKAVLTISIIINILFVICSNNKKRISKTKA